MKYFLIFITLISFFSCRHQKKIEDAESINKGISRFKLGNHLADSLMSAGKYNECIEYLRELINDNKVELSTTDSIDIFNILAAAFRKTGSYDSAKAFLDKSIALNTHTNDTLNLHVAQTYYLYGLFYKDFQNLSQSEKYLLKSLEIRKKKLNAEDPIIGDVYNNLGVIYEIKSEMDKAEKYFKDALRLRKKRGFFDKSVASTYMNLGNLYDNTFEYRKSLACFDSALIIGRKNFGDNHPLTGSIYLNKANVLVHIGLYDSAQTVFNKSLNVFEKTLGNTHPYVAALYNNIANAYMSVQDYQKAIFYLRKSIDLKENNSNYSLKSLFDNYSNMVYSLIAINDLNNAKIYLDKINPLIKKITKLNFENLNNYYLLYVSYLVHLNEYVKAVDKCDEGLKILKKRGKKGYKLRIKKYESLLKGNIGFPKMKEVEECINFFSRDIRSEWLISAKQIKNSLLFHKGDYAELIREVDKQINELNKNLYKHNSVVKSFGKYFVDNIELGILSLEKIKDYNKIITYTDAALNYLEYLHSMVSETESKLISSNKIRRIVEYGLDAAYLLYNTTQDDKYFAKAFGFIESGKSLALQEKLNIRKLISKTKVPVKLITQQKELELRKLQLQRKIEGNSLTDDEKREIRNELFETVVELDSVINLINQKLGDLESIVSVTQEIDFDSLRKKIITSHSLISYFLTDSCLYTIVLTAHSNRFYKTKIKNDINKEIDEFLKSIRENNFSKYKYLAYKLYSLFLPREEVGVLTEKLVIIPDGKISLVPFDALLTDPAKEINNYKQLPYFIKKYSVGYSYSAKILLMGNELDNDVRRALGIAPFALKSEL